LELFGFQDPTTPQVRVLAHVYNIRAAEGRPPDERLHAFPNNEQATRFVDETIVCFEYLGCTITSAPAPVLQMPPVDAIATRRLAAGQD
jgi:hypothetical protein